MADNNQMRQPYPFVNGGLLQKKNFVNKNVTIVGKVDKVLSGSQFVLRSSDGKLLNAD
jgi:hypothetical protein